MVFKPNHKKPKGRGRNRGGQPGHQGTGRRKPKTVDEEKDVYLTHCPDCSNEVGQTTNTYERTIEDIPLQTATITRYYIQKQWCKHCHKEIRGIPENTLPRFRVGLNTIIWILFQKYRLRTPLAKITEALQEQYGMQLTASGIEDILHRLKTKFESKYEEILKEIQSAPVKYADETGWRIAGLNNWCWLFATSKATYYTIEETRGKGVPDAVLGNDPPGVLVRDDYGAYKHLNMPQQSCWVHLLRASREGKSQEAEILHQELKQMFSKLEKVIKTDFNQSWRDQVYNKYLEQINLIITKKYRQADTQKIQTRIANQGANLVTALLYPGVPLTNNQAERQIRPLVVTRKISGGSRSNEGAATHAVNMSVVQTVMLEGKSFFAGIRELLQKNNYPLPTSGE
jgi:transposase